jgi:hypothetical protein
MSKSTRQITFAVPAAEYESFVAEAEMEGVSISEWARRRLRAPVRPEPLVLDEAFRRMDETDALREFREPPPQSAPPPQTDPLVTLGIPVKGAEPHSCANHRNLHRHDGGYPKVCGHPQQVGRPCYFPSAGAQDCVHFHPAG